MAFPNNQQPVLDGLRFNPYYIQADSTTTKTSYIPLDRRSVVISAVTNGASDYVILPALSTVPNGHTLMLLASVKCGLKTQSTEKVNNIDASGTDYYSLEA